MIDYTYFYKSTLSVDASWSSAEKWDVFLSAYNSSERVSAVFEKVQASQKIWIMLHEYMYSHTEHPHGSLFFPDNKGDEASCAKKLIKDICCDWDKVSICIDITGFIKPYIMCLIRYLGIVGVKKVTLLYSEPDIYAEKEETTFSSGSVLDVRQVYGFEGGGSESLTSDLLILGAGYDHKLISYAAQHKEKARKRHLFGLPSLQPAFFQENILRAHRAFEESKDLRENIDTFDVAPANDPFVVASRLRDIANLEQRHGPISNLYLCPLATKPQALGFVLFYLWDCLYYNKFSAAIIYPVNDQHARETSKGISRIWKYEIELPEIP